MSAKTTLPITEVRKRLFEITKAVRKPGVHYTITENGRPTVVIMSVDEFESWQETISVLEDFPNLAEELKEAEENIKAGRTIPFEQVLREHGLNKLAEDYEKRISNRIPSKRKKGSGKNTR